MSDAYSEQRGFRLYQDPSVTQRDPEKAFRPEVLNADVADDDDPRRWRAAFLALRGAALRAVEQLSARAHGPVKKRERLEAAIDERCCGPCRAALGRPACTHPEERLAVREGRVICACGAGVGSVTPPS